MPSALLRAHRFRVGQTVLYTSSPISRPGASGTYKVVKLLPSDGDDYQYRIKIPAKRSSALPKRANWKSNTRARCFRACADQRPKIAADWRHQVP